MTRKADEIEVFGRSGAGVFKLIYINPYGVISHTRKHAPLILLSVAFEEQIHKF